jgi:hypothetical protein
MTPASPDRSGPAPDALASEAALGDVPTGAFALAGAAVALLLVAWLLVYFAVFIPRGPVG